MPKIIKTGNSAALTIPVNFFKTLGLQIGDNTEVRFDFQKARLTYIFPIVRQLRLSDSKPRLSTKANKVAKKNTSP